MFSFLSMVSALWMGLLITIGGFVVPILFKLLPLKTAANIAGELFYGVNIIGLISNLIIIVLINQSVHSFGRQLFSSGISNAAKRCRWYALFSLITIGISSLINFTLLNIRNNNPSFILYGKIDSQTFTILHNTASIIYALLIILSIILYIKITKFLLNISH